MYLGASTQSVQLGGYTVGPIHTDTDPTTMRYWVQSDASSETSCCFQSRGMAIKGAATALDMQKQLYYIQELSQKLQDWERRYWPKILTPRRHDETPWFCLGDYMTGGIGIQEHFMG